MHRQTMFKKAYIFVILCILQLTEGALKRCYSCRSRSELGSCKDPFLWNITQAEHEPGIEVQPCASGWCGKILETENALKEEYGIATQRMCLQRGPSDDEDRCAYTMWNRKRVYMCLCQGDICNRSSSIQVPKMVIFTSFALTSVISFLFYR